MDRRRYGARMSMSPQPPTAQPNVRKRQAVIAGGAIVAALAIAVGSYEAGRATSDPEALTATTTPSPRYTRVGIGFLCENTNASAVGDDGRTYNCVYAQGRATWQLPTPSPSPSPSSAPAKPAATTKPAPPPPPPLPTIDDGTWTVGVDFPPGTYRVTAQVSSDCYWAITKSGSNGENIIANDIPGGGRPTVVLRKGQEFETNDCGTWEKRK